MRYLITFLLSFFTVCGSFTSALTAQKDHLKVYFDWNDTLPPFFIKTQNESNDSLQFEFTIQTVGVLKSRNPIFYLPDSGSYSVFVKAFDKKGDLVAEELRFLKTDLKDTLLFYSPNYYGGCGGGDIMEVKILGEFTDFHLMVFNRWGQILFESWDYQKQWNFRTEPIHSSQENYVYKVDFTSYTGKHHEVIGHFTVVQ